ncbi:MAG: RNA-binding protein [bacterium]
MKIYIGGISQEVSEKDLWDLYSQFGKVLRVDLLQDKESGLNRGYAFVEFEDDDSGEAAILGTHNTLLGGNTIAVSVSRSRLDQKRARFAQLKQVLNGRNPGNYGNNRYYGSNYNTGVSYRQSNDRNFSNTRSYDRNRVAESNDKMNFLGKNDVGMYNDQYGNSYNDNAYNVKKFDTNTTYSNNRNFINYDRSNNQNYMSQSSFYTDEESKDKDDVKKID